MGKIIKTICIIAGITGVITSAILQNWLAMFWSFVYVLAVFGWEITIDL
jgi:hypothetical protein